MIELLNDSLKEFTGDHLTKILTEYSKQSEIYNKKNLAKDEKTSDKRINILYNTLKECIENQTIEAETKINVTKISDHIRHLTKLEIRVALNELNKNKGYTEKEGIFWKVARNTSHLPPEESRGSNFSVKEWAGKNNIELKTTILKIEKGIYKDFNHPVAWQNMEVEKNDELIQIRRLRQMRRKTDNKFFNAIIEVSYISPKLLNGFFEYFRQNKNKETGFHEYYRSVQKDPIRSTYDLAIKPLHEAHCKYWADCNPKFDKNKDQFLRIKVTTHSIDGPLEFSHSYLNPKLLSLKIFKMDFVFNENINPKFQ